jgi:hypothetical protein
MVLQFRLIPGNIPINCQNTENSVRKFKTIGNCSNSEIQNLTDNRSCGISTF